jgi:hypothetical protein
MMGALLTSSKFTTRGQIKIKQHSSVMALIEWLTRNFSRSGKMPEVIQISSLNPWMSNLNYMFSMYKCKLCAFSHTRIQSTRDGLRQNWVVNFFDSLKENPSLLPQGESGQFIWGENAEKGKGKGRWIWNKGEGRGNTLGPPMLEVKKYLQKEKTEAKRAAEY